MKRYGKHGFSLVLMTLSALMIVFSPLARAAGEKASLNAASGTSQVGSSFTINAEGHVGVLWWGGGPSYVKGKINYPANLLRVTSTSLSGSAFPKGTVTPNNSTGVLDFDLDANSWSTAAKNKDVHLFSITFQSLASGMANVTFGTVKYETGTAATSGGSYTISTPPPSPSPSPSATPKPTTTPKPSASQTPSPSPAATTSPSPSSTPTPEETPAPVNESDGSTQITEVVVTANRQRNSVSWKTNDGSAVPTLAYGTSKTTIKTESEVTKQADGSYQTIFKDLKLGTLYYFTIKVASTDKLKGALHTGSLTTRGYPVQLTVQQNGLLLPNAKVVIDERSFVANGDGIISTELGDGHFSATVTPAGSSTPFTVQFAVQKKTIPSSGSPELQDITLNAGGSKIEDASDGSTVQMLVIGGIIFVVLLTSIVGYVIYRRRTAPVYDDQVDADLLSSSYGQALENTGSNTPTPALETIGIVAPSPNPAPEPYPQIVEPATASMAVQIQPVDNPTTLPQEPVEVTTPTDITMPLPPADPYDSQQLSPEIAQIESKEEVAAEPSAVYDETTGELDIIHHNDHHSDTTPAVSDPQPSGPAQTDLPTTDSSGNDTTMRPSPMGTT